MIATLTVDQLRMNAHSIVFSLYTPFQQITDTEFTHEATISSDISAENSGEFASVVFISHNSLPKLNALKLYGMTDWEWRVVQEAQLKTMQISFNLYPA
jgi:hypothetical protein